MWATNGGHAETMTVLVVTLRHEGRRRYDKILYPFFLKSSYSHFPNKLRYAFAKSDFYIFSDPTRHPAPAVAAVRRGPSYSLSRTVPLCRVHASLPHTYPPPSYGMLKRFGKRYNTYKAVSLQ